MNTPNKNRGQFLNRTTIADAAGQLEKALSDEWSDENETKPWMYSGSGLLQALFNRSEYIGQMFPTCTHEVTDSERMVAATVIQWLGTNVGRGFLDSAFRRAGWTIEIKPPRLQTGYPEPSVGFEPTT